MNAKELAEARRELDTAGSPSDRDTVGFELKERLTDDIETLGGDIAGVEQDFRDYLGRWTTASVPDETLPHVRDEDRDDYRVMLASAIAAVVGESALAAWTFSVQKINPWYGVASAVIITLLLHGALGFILNDKERPKLIIDRLRRYFFRPSLIAFALAAAIGIPVRYVRGVLALIGRDIFPVALSVATLALLTLAASLLAAQSKMRWSVRSERHWHKLRHIISENKTFLHLLERPSQSDSSDQHLDSGSRSELTAVPDERKS